jgi:hypothetical protein
VSWAIGSVGRRLLGGELLHAIVEFDRRTPPEFVANALRRRRDVSDVAKSVLTGDLRSATTECP